MARGDIVIRGDTARVKSLDGKSVAIPVSKLLEQAMPSHVDSGGFRLPREARFAYSRGKLLILACEYPPGPYTLSWITDRSPAPFGPGAEYEPVTLSLPYVIVLAVFEDSFLSSHNECFFRKEPLTEVDEDNELLYPGLLNCSRFMPPQGKPLSWICTEHLDYMSLHFQTDSRKRIAEGLEALRHCLFEQSFNMSSDFNELSSWYTESRSVDERISSPRRWHDATRCDRYMGLDVPWLKTNETLKSVVERIFRINAAAARGISNARQLARLMIHYAG